MPHSPAPRRPGVRARVLAAAALAAAALPAAARAQFALDKLEMSLTPGDSAARSGVLLVRNEGSTRAQATIKVEDWDRTADGTNRFFPAGTVAGSCGSALTVYPRALSLAPGELQQVRISWDGAAPRAECWSVVLVEAATPQLEAKGRIVMYTLRTGAKVYATPAAAAADGEVRDIVLGAAHPAAAAPKAAADTALDGQRVEVAFANTGGRHVVARGRVEVRRADNTTAATAELPPAYALPGATMLVRGTLPRLAPGRYVLLAVFDYGGGEFAAAQREYEVR